MPATKSTDFFLLPYNISGIYYLIPVLNSHLFVPIWCRMVEIKIRYQILYAWVYHIEAEQSLYFSYAKIISVCAWKESFKNKSIISLCKSLLLINWSNLLLWSGFFCDPLISLGFTKFVDSFSLFYLENQHPQGKIVQGAVLKMNWL